MEFDFEKALAECRAKKKDNEEICFTVGVGRMLPLKTDSRQTKRNMEKAIEFIKGLEGFKGVHPVSLHKTMLIFDTLNNAKGAKNLITAKGIGTGYHIVPILVDKRYL